MKINLTKDEWLSVLYGLERAVDDQEYGAEYESDEETSASMREDAKMFDGLHAKISEQFYRQETYAERFIREYGELYADQDVRDHYEGKGVESMELTPDKRFVIVHWITGGDSRVNVEMDSVSAMVVDIDRQAF